MKVRVENVDGLVRLTLVGVEHDEYVADVPATLDPDEANQVATMLNEASATARLQARLLEERRAEKAKRPACDCAKNNAENRARGWTEGYSCAVCRTPRTEKARRR